MFEKCGIIDIFYAIRKNIKFIALVTCAFLVLGICLSVFSTNIDETVGISDEKEELVASACYSVKYREKPANETTEEALNAEQMIARTIISLLKADFTREKIYTTLLQKYSKADIIEAFDLDCREENLNAFDLREVLQGDVISATSIINIYVQSTNKQLSKDFLDIVKGALSEIADSVENIEVSYINGVLDVFNSNGKKQQEMYEMSFTRFWLIMPIIGLILTLLFIIAKAMFFPTLNRRRDFCAYDMPVIAEMSRKYNIKNRKVSESLQFNAYRMLNYMKDNNIKTCAVVTTLKNKRYVNELLNNILEFLAEKGENVGIVDSLNELENSKYENAFISTADICKDVDALEICKKSNGVLFFEEYGKSYNSNIYEAIETLKISDVKTIGVFAVK